MPKTLYVSDLDGTLMHPDARISDTSVRLLNEAISQGKMFSIATARTPATVSGILSRVEMRLPAIVFTGAALWDTRANTYSHVRHFSEKAAREVIDRFRETRTSTFLFTLDRDMIDIYHLNGKLLPLQREFMEERLDSPHKRFHISEDGSDTLPPDLSKTILFYTMLPDAMAAEGFARIRDVEGIKPQYYHDIYGPEVGILEAFSAESTKAKALRTLAEMVGAERTVCFGDNINDLPMMAAADLAVAVENALPEVREAADIVIGPNTADSVARFIHDDRP